jgi:hypothetical protein
MRNITAKLIQASKIAQRVALLSLLSTGYSLLLGLNQPAWSQPTTPQTCRVGLYLISLQNFNPVDSNFTADFWLWSVCPSNVLKPLQTMEIVGATNVQTAYDNEQDKKDPFGAFKSQNKVYWSQRKISAKFYHSWNLENFPFDRHTLEIPLEEANLDANAFAYTPDMKYSTYKRDLTIDGWTITQFKLKGSKTSYNTTFGDPELTSGESKYSRMSAAIEIQRDSFVTFFKLVAGVYAAFATILLAFFLEPGEEFGSRTGLLVGSLFAVLVSMQGVESVLGRSTALTLVDKIHISALGYILLGVVASVYSRILFERGYVKESLKFDRLFCFSFFVISFLILNIAIIYNAMLRG